MELKELAKRLIDYAESTNEFTNSTMALFLSKGSMYFGDFRTVYPEMTELVFVSKTSNPVQNELYKEVLKERPNTPILSVDDEIDFSDQYHLLRMEDGMLIRMSKEQTEFAAENPLIVFDSDGNLITPSFC